jgi:Patatin-like phospholipase
MANEDQSLKPPDTGSMTGPEQDNGKQGPQPLYEILEEEYTGMHGPLPKDYYTANTTPEARLKAIYALIHALTGQERRAALCISGGGIRSATFALGVLQGLARCGLLGKFHYLSTVSGGGYIGSWLSSWIKRADTDTVVAALAGATVKATEVEPPPIRHLRSYSNYLSPKLGLLSADTWTLVAIYIRNLFLNWLVMVPFLAAVLMVPRIYAALLRNVIMHAHQSDLILLIVGTLFGILAVAYIGLNRPAVRKEQQSRGQAAYLWFCLLPLTLSAILVTLYWAAYYQQTDYEVPLRYFLLFGLAINVFGYLLWVFMRRAASLQRVFGELLAAAATGLLSGWLLWLASTARFFFTGPDNDVSPLSYTCLAVPVVLGIFQLSAFLYNGLISFWTNDDDREWWSRSDAWILIVIGGWAAFSALVIFGPIWLDKLYVSGIGGLSGVIALLLGKSSDTPANQKTSDAKKGLTTLIKENALKIAAPLFLIFLLILLSAGTSFLLFNALTSEFLADNFFPLTGITRPPAQTVLHRGVELVLPAPALALKAFDYEGVIYDSWLRLVILGFLILLLVSAVVAYFININRYSLHAMYRNRLIRAYLGASVPDDQRQPNKFTGFDPNDNFPVHLLAPPVEQKARLFHVLNLTLNLVAGKELAWQERKAESFTVSPLHSGSRNPELGYRSSVTYGGVEKEPTESGISLGTAMAISGAAASPNMGYHSSTVVGFLMTLFNARLGWWLGNPGKAGEKTYDKDGPFWALKPLIAEALGLTDDQSSYVYLSDGGHFENLGLYEMVQRRCHFIVVSDAGCDEKCSYEDLGNAIRKIRIDMGIPIEFNLPINIFPRSANQANGQYCALAGIRYSCVDGAQARDGILVYIKPSFYGNEPRDVYNYAIAHTAFPHESTADQFFTESQFESYRMLGSHIMETICGEGQSTIDFDQFIGLVARHLRSGLDAIPTPHRFLQEILKDADRLADQPSALEKPPQMHA